jgi:hypothetical protein
MGEERRRAAPLDPFDSLAMLGRSGQDSEGGCRYVDSAIYR